MSKQYYSSNSDIYLKSFEFPDIAEEDLFLSEIRRTCYDTFYPFRIMATRNIKYMDFDAITILYGENGSGKSTALNVIGEKLGLERDSLYNRSNFYEDYLRCCSFYASRIPEGSSIITSDDVFDYMMNIRALNGGIDIRRDELIEEAVSLKYSSFRMTSLNDYDKLVKSNDAKRLTQSKFVRKNVMGNIREQSNGETGLRYFMEKITENSLYLLDEPENSLSAGNQEKLGKFILDSARFYGCQFVIATHSPYLLSIPGARIYNMDEEGMVCRWTDLPNVRKLYDFFMEHRSSFDI